MNVDAIFDAMGKASALIALQDKINAKKKDLLETKEKRCGKCSYWMTSGCTPETKHKQFKSAKSLGCKDFDREAWVTDSIEKKEKEISELSQKLNDEVL